MAHSRLEKIGTIYNRTRGLIQSGALNYNDRPLWYDIYEAFPPKEEPRFDRPKPNVAIREIFYNEDTIRAVLHKNIKGLGTVNVLNRKIDSFTQKFINVYQKIEQQYGENQQDREKLFREALDIIKRDREVQGSDPDDVILPSTFKDNDVEQHKGRKHNGDKFSIKLKDLFNK